MNARAFTSISIFIPSHIDHNPITMNKLLFILGLFVIPILGSSQIEQGNFLLSAKSDLNYINRGPSASNTFQVSHELAYMFTNRLLVGGGVQLAINDNLTGINSLLRYYLTNQDQKAWFTSNRISWLGYILTTEVDMGYSAPLNPFLVLETKVYYNYQRPFPNGFQSNRLGLQTKLQLFINRNWQAQQSRWENVLQQGSWMIGGTTSEFFYEKGYGESANLQFRPNIGMMWTDRLLIGGQVDADLTYLISHKTHYVSLAILPFARHYFPRFSHRTIGFLEGGYGLFYRSWKLQEAQFDEIDSAYFGALGFNSFIAPHIAFELKGIYQKLGRLEERLSLQMGFQFFLE